MLSETASVKETSDLQDNDPAGARDNKRVGDLPRILFPFKTEKKNSENAQYESSHQRKLGIGKCPDVKALLVLIRIQYRVQKPC